MMPRNYGYVSDFYSKRCGSPFLPCNISALFLIGCGLLSASQPNAIAQDCEAVRFPYPTFAVGNSTTSVSNADLNGDGYLDLIVTNAGSQDISVLLNRGDGIYLPESRYAGPGDDPENALGGIIDRPQQIRAADLDNDGDLDLVIANGIPAGTTNIGSLSYLLNDGDGRFGDENRIPVDRSPWSVALADIDQDGDIDILAVNRNQNNISLVLNNSETGFQESQRLETGIIPNSLITADFNDDQLIDIATATGSGVTVHIGLGDGAYAPHEIYAGTGSIDLSAADLDGDGDLDLAYVNENARRAGLLINDGDGMFALLTTYHLGAIPNTLETADLDSDGDIDLAVACDGLDVLNGHVAVLLNNGDASYSAPTCFHNTEYPVDCAIGDYDLDGTPDIAVLAGPDVRILFGEGEGTYLAPTGIQAGYASTIVKLGDVDGDSIIDMLVLNSGSDDFSLFRGAENASFLEEERFPVHDGAVTFELADADVDGDLDILVLTNAILHIYTNDSTGSFEPVALHVIGSFTGDLTTGDIDGNGYPDIVIAKDSDEQVPVLMHTGKGVLFERIYLESPVQPGLVDLADLDMDGDLDLYVSGISGANPNNFECVVFLNIEGTLTALTPFGPGGPTPADTIFADINADGKVDVLSAVMSGTRHLRVARGNGDGTFEPGIYYPFGSTAAGIAAADVDGDGFLDVVLANRGGESVSVMINNGFGGFLTELSFVSGARTWSMAVHDIDHDSDPDIIVCHRMGENILMGGVRILLNNSTNGCAADITDDGSIDLQDLNLVLTSFGTHNCAADANKSGLVDLADLQMILADFGKQCL